VSIRRKSSILRRGCIGILLIVVMSAVVLGGLAAAAIKSPSFGAQGADFLRSIFGDQAVASLEMALFQVQDTLQQARYRAGLTTPEVPWQLPTAAAASLEKNPITTPQSIAAVPSSPPVTDTMVPESTAAPGTLIETPVVISTPTLAPTADIWQPVALKPLGSLQGEGVWTPYIQTASGGTVAYRTFLQPDPGRPFAVVAVVAFDLAQTRLHYVLGYEEPYSPDGPKRSGAMPASDKAPGLLLAMFNGGFKATHGQFGAMSDGVVALPPRDGIGTLAIYKDGRVRIGNWGSDITSSDNLLAWRQNGPLVVQNGQINQEIYSNSPKDWGYTVKDVSPTWRSGIAISPDGGTLYYFAGPSLSMETLAQSMLSAGVAAALQLDINNYWVHFVAVRPQGNKLALDPLFPEAMNSHIDRYLYPYGRDFFYVTANP